MAIKLNFTKASIDALPLPDPGKRSEYQDIKTTGLRLRITFNGIKTFCVLRRIKGTLERITLGRYPELTIEQARRKTTNLNSAIADGKNPANIIRAYKEEMTLDDLFNEYMTRTAAFNKRPDKPKANYRLYLSQWGKRKLSSIKHEEVDRLHKKLGRDKGRVTANIALKLLHVMYNKAINEWRIWKGENAAHGIKKFPEQSRDRFIQSDELPKFFKALAEEENDAMRDYFLSLKVLALQINDELLKNPNTARWGIEKRANHIELTFRDKTITVNGKAYPATMVNSKKYAVSTIAGWITDT